MNRLKLIERINKAMFRDEDKGCVKPSEIADFVEAEVARIVEPLINTENIIGSSIKTDGERRRYAQIFNEKRRIAIEETLERASGANKGANNAI